MLLYIKIKLKYNCSTFYNGKTNKMLKLIKNINVKKDNYNI